MTTMILAFGLLKFWGKPPAQITRQDAHRLFAITTDKWSHVESEAYVKIVERESSLRPYCTTSRSSSAGLYGFLRGTRKAYRVTLSDPLVKQSRAFLAYVKHRYGTLAHARAHHMRYGWY